ncbi:TatD family deoxyribonuclease [Chromatium weissei]|nr:TatD family deoxyribonuclease [Chromatium weissei]
MFIDSHCHLDRIDLTPFDGDFARFIAACDTAKVTQLLCVAIDLEHYSAMRQLIDPFPQIAVSVGVHPNHDSTFQVTVDQLVALAADARCVAIGETGLDYYRSSGDLNWQHERFRIHIAAARACGKPLIIHNREAGADIIRVLTEEKAHEIGGVIHCFTDSWDIAEHALNLDFYISFSGVVTFKSAEELREVARRVPLERILIETDAPYLAPVPHRGKPNSPCFIPLIATVLADIHGIPLPEFAAIVRANYQRLFNF